MILNIKFDLTGVTLNVKKGERIYVKKVKNADDILKGLDKILKKNKIEVTDIKVVKVVDNLKKVHYTSYRIAKAIQKALNFSLKLNQSQKLF